MKVFNYLNATVAEGFNYLKATRRQFTFYLLSPPGGPGTHLIDLKSLEAAMTKRPI